MKRLRRASHRVTNINRPLWNFFYDKLQSRAAYILDWTERDEISYESGVPFNFFASVFFIFYIYYYTRMGGWSRGCFRAAQRAKDQSRVHTCAALSARDSLVNDRAGVQPLAQRPSFTLGRKPFRASLNHTAKVTGHGNALLTLQAARLCVDEYTLEQCTQKPQRQLRIRERIRFVDHKLYRR